MRKHRAIVARPLRARHELNMLPVAGVIAGHFMNHLVVRLAVEVAPLTISTL